jgi:hypothetical protein
LGGKPFDLQVVPNSRSRQVHREIPEALVLRPDEIGDSRLPTDQVSSQEWVSVIRDGLRDQSGSFSSLLRRFSFDVHPKRSRMSVMAEVFSLVEGIQPAARNDCAEGVIKRLIETVANGFPDAREATRLKRALVRSEPDFLGGAIDLQNEAWLKAILTADVRPGADTSFLDFTERIQGIWHDDRGAALRIAAGIKRSTRLGLSWRHSLCAA